MQLSGFWVNYYLSVFSCTKQFYIVSNLCAPSRYCVSVIDAACWSVLTLMHPLLCVLIRYGVWLLIRFVASLWLQNFRVTAFVVTPVVQCVDCCRCLCLLSVCLLSLGIFRILGGMCTYFFILGPIFFWGLWIENPDSEYWLHIFVYVVLL